MKKIILKNQEKLIKKLKSFDDKKSLSALTESNCSEISRLFACCLLNDLPDIDIYVLKSKGLFNDSKTSHDILLVKNGVDLYLIDPTIWQFFKNKKNILIKKTNCLYKAFCTLNKNYGGTWVISEKITKSNFKEIDNYLSIIEKNINLNV